MDPGSFNPWTLAPSGRASRGALRSRTPYAADAAAQTPEESGGDRWWASRLSSRAFLPGLPVPIGDFIAFQPMHVRSALGRGRFYQSLFSISLTLPAVAWASRASRCRSKVGKPEPFPSLNRSACLPDRPPPCGRRDRFLCGRGARMRRRDYQSPRVLDALLPGGGRITASETIVSPPSSRSVS